MNKGKQSDEEAAKPRIGYVAYEDEEEGEDGEWSGYITGPSDPTGANLAWQNPTPFIEKRAYDALAEKVKRLEALLEDVCNKITGEYELPFPQSREDCKPIEMARKRREYDVRCAQEALAKLRAGRDKP